MSIDFRMTVRQRLIFAGYIVKLGIGIKMKKRRKFLLGFLHLFGSELALGDVAYDASESDWLIGGIFSQRFKTFGGFSGFEYCIKRLENFF